jgi:Protein of unknown function (DUF4242)
MRVRPTYLVEVYVARAQLGDAHRTARRAREAAEELTREGTSVRYVRTTFLPDDETCFHVFEASERDAVVELSRRAGLADGRIVPAFED